jgi:uncharacterized protein (DUF885 family)
MKKGQRVPTGLEPLKTGRRMSEDTKRKISEALKKRNKQERAIKPPKLIDGSIINQVNDKERKEKETMATNPGKKKVHKDETKKKIADAMKNYHSKNKNTQKEIVEKLKKIIAQVNKTYKG